MRINNFFIPIKVNIYFIKIINYKNKKFEIHHFEILIYIYVSIINWNKNDSNYIMFYKYS